MIQPTSEQIRDGSWKAIVKKRYNWHWKEKVQSFFGLKLPMYHRFDVRELFILLIDFAGDMNFPSYKECWRRLLGKKPKRK